MVLLSDYCAQHNASIQVIQYKKSKYLLNLSIFSILANLAYNFLFIPILLSIPIWDTMIQPVSMAKGPTIQPSYSWSWKYVWRLFVIAWLECLTFALVLMLLLGFVGGGLYLLYFLWPTNYMMIAGMTIFALFCLPLILFCIMSWGAFLARFSLFLYLNFPQKFDEKESDVELVDSTTNLNPITHS